MEDISSEKIGTLRDIILDSADDKKKNIAADISENGKNTAFNIYNILSNLYYTDILTLNIKIINKILAD